MKTAAILRANTGNCDGRLRGEKSGETRDGGWGLGRGGGGGGLRRQEEGVWGHCAGWRGRGASGNNYGYCQWSR